QYSARRERSCCRARATPTRGMPEATNLTFIAAPLTGNQLKELIQIPPRRKESAGGFRWQGGVSVVAARVSAQKPEPVECHKPRQSPAPGFGEKYLSLSDFPSLSLESGGGAFLTVIFGQILANSAFSNSHFSSPGSLSALIASTGHSGSQTPQSMHSSGWMTSMFSPS